MELSIYALLFRSLANLTAHKRSYCLEKYEEVNHVFSSKAGAEAASLRTVIVEGELVETVIPEENTENLSPSLGKNQKQNLEKKHECKSILSVFRFAERCWVDIRAGRKVAQQSVAATKKESGFSC